MTPEEIYTKLLFKVNKNDTNANIKIPKGVFVILFNEQKRKYLDQELAEDESSDQIESFNEILSKPTRLIKIEELKNYDNFALPEDFLKRVSSYSLATKDTCKDNVLVNWFAKPKDINVLLQNSNQRPSFEYQETLALVNNDSITVYKDGFSINNVYLTYYKDPPDLDIEGYIHTNNTPSTNVETTLSDLNIDKILDRTVVEISNNYQNIEQLQMALQRQQQNERKQ